MHFAAFKSPSESTTAPWKYYYNNVLATLNLLETMGKYQVTPIGNNRQTMVLTPASSAYRSLSDSQFGGRLLQYCPCFVCSTGTLVAPEDLDDSPRLCRNLRRRERLGRSSGQGSTPLAR